MPESRLKKAGQTIGGRAVVILIPTIGLLLIVLMARGIVWATDKLMPWLLIATGITILIVIFVLPPMCLFRKARGLGGVGCVYASWVFGTELWAYSCLFVVHAWDTVH